MSDIKPATDAEVEQWLPRWGQDAEHGIVQPQDDRILFLIARIRAEQASQATAREQAIRECIAICEQRSEDFLSPEYAYPQPVGSFLERFAIDGCIDGISKLLQSQTGEETK